MKYYLKFVLYSYAFIGFNYILKELKYAKYKI